MVYEVLSLEERYGIVTLSEAKIKLYFQTCTSHLNSVLHECKVIVSTLNRQNFKKTKNNSF